MAATNSKWAMSSEEAQNYILDPLNGPLPNDDTGLNSSFRSTFAKASPTTPPNQALSPLRSAKTRSRATSNPSAPVTDGTGGDATGSGTPLRGRSGSLNQRYPGDMSHRPLAMLKHDAKAAHRSPHLRKRSIPGVDQIDALDTVPGGQYHHGGPFDATLLSRNLNATTSPVAAVASSNAETLRATPPENIGNALQHHRPLDGVAAVPPGERDRFGRVYQYDETNIMTEYGGDDKRSNVELLNDGQRRLRNHITVDEANRADSSGYEMLDHRSNKKSVEVQEREIDGEPSSKRHSLGTLKKRIGSIRRKKD